VRTEGVTILIPTFERNHLLRWNLKTLAAQYIDRPFEVIILDDRHAADMECEKLVRSFERKLNAHYVHSGQTKGSNYWRVPGFPFNIGARLASHPRLILCCAEIYHLDSTIWPLAARLEEKWIPRPKSGKYDQGPATRVLEATGEITTENYNAIRANLPTEIPFLMGVRKADYFAIGGYDEDFTGVSAEDVDFIRRLEAYGCTPVDVPETRIVHLHHTRKRKSGALSDGEKRRMAYNRELLAKKREAGVVVANENREWGKL
jgi:hypothetical protein